LADRIRLAGWLQNMFLQAQIKRWTIIRLESGPYNPRPKKQKSFLLTAARDAVSLFM